MNEGTIARWGRLAALVVVGASGAACKAKAIAQDTSAPAAPPPGSSATAAAGGAPKAAPSAAPSGGVCQADPAGGVVVPVHASSQDFRLAALGERALVTWLEPPGQAGGRRAMGRVFDAAAHALAGDARVLDQTQYGDEIQSGAAPQANGALTAISCTNEAPVGETSCFRVPADGGKGTELFTAKIINFGMQDPGIAALSSASGDTLIVLPEGGAGDVALFSTRGPKKRAREFAGGADTTTHADALAATWLTADEAAVVYRHRGALHGRVGGLDEKWRGKRVAISDPGFAVGAPAIASLGGAAVVLFATRKAASEPWHLVRAEWRGDTVTKATFDGSEAATQAAALAPRGDGKCLYVAWVEGTGDRTTTRVGTMCDGHVSPASVGTLSSAGVEGGRAVLATSERGTFAAWQEFPKGKPAELRVARVTCP